MLKYLMSAGVLAVLGTAGAVAAPAGPVTPSDPAAIEAYRRLPYCRLAPDGRHLAEEPCRRPPTRSFAERRAAPAMPPQHARQHPAPAGDVAAGRAAPATPAAPLTPLTPMAPASSVTSSAPAVPPVVTLPPVPPVAQPSLQPLNQCDVAGCRGANGALYQQGAGNIVLDPSGRMCTRQGQFVHCP